MFAKLMNRNEALATIKDGLTPDSKHAGLCSHLGFKGGAASSGFPAKLVRVDGTQVFYSGVMSSMSGGSVSGNVTQGTGQLSTTYASAEDSFDFDLEKITIVRLKSGSECTSDYAGRSLRLQIGTSQIIIVEVDNRRFDRFVAAVKVLVPNAQWKEGVGL
jgi:hypothetical protein